MSNRKKTEANILTFMKKIDLSGYNEEKYKEILKDMSDKTLDDLMDGIIKGEKSLILYTPLTKSKGITVKNGLKVAEEYKIPMFERLVREGDSLVADNISPQEYLLLDLGSRIQSQSLDKKASIPKHNKAVDQLTYQPTGDSKGSNMSQPESGVLDSMGLHNSLEELIRFRGGDKGGYAAYNESINKLGSVSLDAVSPYATGVVSTKTLKSYFLGMHLVYKD